MPDAEHLDVLVVGAGISGICTAYHLGRRCPDRSYAILEARAAMGGTWDLFRYPGIRSDSDMHTLGFAFEPWTGDRAIADGAAIRSYVEETARRHGIDRKVRYGVRVQSADWSTPDARWTVRAAGPDGEALTFTCDWLAMCAGYYDYSAGYMPDFPGAERYNGRLVHPQSWPDDLDWTGRRVVVIGSGATAVTLVPALARTAAHVVMLQRSPSYVVSRPSADRVADWLRARLPARLAYRLTRWKNVALGMFFYRLARRRPGRVRDRLLGMVRDELGPDFDVGTHFTPRYAPWDQRLCLVPDSDLFESLRSGRAEIVTDRIAAFTEAGLRLKSGRELAADVVVAATGLELQMMGGLAVSVDGERRDMAESLNYKGMMFSDVPNLSSTFGYTNASWTLKAELTARYLCRLLNVMGRRGVRQATPRVGGRTVERLPLLDFSSGYVRRAADRMPGQGSRAPWRLHQNYALDLLATRFGSVDADMEFSNPPTVEPARSAAWAGRT